MSAPAVLRLWPEDGGVRVWTPRRMAWLPQPTPGPESLAPHTLREGWDRPGLRAALWPELADSLEAALADAGDRPLRLRLARGLPPAWRDAPWEWLLDPAGQPLLHRLVVARDTPSPDLPDAVLAARRGVALDLWPADQRHAECCHGAEFRNQHHRTDGLLGIQIKVDEALHMRGRFGLGTRVHRASGSSVPGMPMAF